MLPRLSLLLLPLLLALTLRPTSSPPLNPFSAPDPRVLLITAHPDDESFFFAPTVLALRARGTEVHSLCLSAGNADGLGGKRVRELEHSLDILGIEKDARWLVNHPHLQDNLTAAWDVRAVANAIRPYVVDNHITTILTFDSGGITGHPNHVAIPLGVAHLLTSPSLASLPTPRLYTLISVPAATKFTGLLAPLLAKLDLSMGVLLQYFFPAYPLGTEAEAALQVFVSGAGEYARGVRAARAHASQMVWFRWLYVLFSRYMWVNEWLKVRPAGNTSAGV